MKLAQFRLLIALGLLLLVNFSSAQESPNAWTSSDPTYPVGLREFPQNNPEIPEIWAYTDKMSYQQGDEVVVYVHTNAPTYDLSIERDGGTTKKVLEEKGLKGMAQETPEDAYVKGCGWKESYRLKIPAGWASGVYVISLAAEIPDKGTAMGEHFFVVKNARPGRTRTRGKG